MSNSSVCAATQKHHHHREAGDELRGSRRRAQSAVGSVAQLARARRIAMRDQRDRERGQRGRDHQGRARPQQPFDQRAEPDRVGVVGPRRRPALRKANGASHAQPTGRRQQTELAMRTPAIAPKPNISNEGSSASPRLVAVTVAGVLPPARQRRPSAAAPAGRRETASSRPSAPRRTPRRATAAARARLASSARRHGSRAWSRR